MKPATRKKKIKIEVPIEREPTPFLTEWTCTGYVCETSMTFKNVGQTVGLMKFGTAVTSANSDGCWLPSCSLPIPKGAFACVQQGMSLRIRVEVFA